MTIQFLRWCQDRTGDLRLALAKALVPDHFKYAYGAFEILHQAGHAAEMQIGDSLLRLPEVVQQIVRERDTFRQCGCCRGSKESREE